MPSRINPWKATTCSSVNTDELDDGMIFLSEVLRARFHSSLELVNPGRGMEVHLARVYPKSL